MGKAEQETGPMWVLQSCHDQGKAAVSTLVGKAERKCRSNKSF